MSGLPPRTGAQVLVDQLRAQGVERVTCVPGESYLAVLDALRDSGIDVLVCRQEGGAAIMAEAAGKLTGRPGICFVTRGPGATNASAGVHIARQDSTPMILFVGQIARRMRDREAFQEVDYRQMFGGVAKWAVEIDDAARIPEILARAFRVAMQGRPGPVVVALPEDMLDDVAAVPDAPRVVPAAPAPSGDDVARLRAMLAEARRPVVLLGGSRWTPGAVAAMAAWAERHDLPVAVSFRRAQLFPADHPNFAGELGIGPNPALLARIREADLLLMVGGRLSEMPAQSYGLLGIPDPGLPLVHVHADAAELGRVYQPALAIEAAPETFCAVLPDFEATGTGRAAEAHAAYRAWSETPEPKPGAFQYGAAITWLRERLPPDAVICNGAGNFATWVHRYYRFRAFGTQLAPTSGSMGYGLPAAVMAKRSRPERIVVALAGDGDVMMTVQEFATAVQYGIAVVVVVLDNGMYGTIRMHQEREYPGRVSATELRNPDFAALARACGGHGERVERTEEFAPAFERGLASGLPAMIHCLVDPEALTPTMTLAAIREKALAAQRG
ncbi:MULTISPECIES: thiamine pyrophosphate-binding protein [Methylobacterium]|uniref:Thiamine pyrophosphate protein domain protein TPP-binding n=1 Tax=Methylobacterium radiotolerans (strain ATCC 27329 / DSM 1819 / JCM 2831 / NBRC 15690 / NCIMB 10815 / 0-1) TaxID=426355 RepID=B1LVN1_METRJ|nr:MULTISPECIES: thiamine pyrophosphate-binding protein [Methylobacterium]ACB24112.1 thiamine pyrophosphate protein domain protein TPP-binding [Methylobacterium radiotolerans JCM 2831]KIU34584.1 thiamine pyrophosphate-binding protein [Methylobacterium radiotolerans]KTS08321.1 thiamine pyrophosphate-binding protein [Methylobacterium radiotolerans]KTS44746.1 thiamine pyrophosphate-binding protein [Methylobacterium radiotolerans]MDE3748295.1 thiamine pyrophosphate-binding protein [Methylobacteriu